MRRAAFAVLIAGITLAGTAIPSGAEITQTDMLVAGRAIGFIQSLKRGEVRVGIVYDPGIALSEQQANEFDGAMGSGLRIGSLVLKPVMLPIGKLDNGGVELFLLTDGMSAEAAAVGRASRGRRIPCITFDLAQVRNGNCAIGVRSDPKIEVFVNRAAAEASGTDLAAVFRMMITEI